MSTTKSRKRAPGFPRGRKFVPPKGPVREAEVVTPAAELVVATEPETVASVTAGIIDVLDQVDAYMATRGGRTIDFQALYHDQGTLGKLRNKMLKLRRQYEGFGETEEEQQANLEALVGATYAPAGEVPSWARAGNFLMWIGIVPIRCYWGGFMEPSTSAMPADPETVFVHNDRLPSRIVDDTVTDVADHFRRGIIRSTGLFENVRGTRRSMFRLAPLDPHAKHHAAEYLADNEWLRDAIERGPVDPVPMPKHIRSIQLAL